MVVLEEKAKLRLRTAESAGRAVGSPIPAVLTFLARVVAVGVGVALPFPRPRTRVEMGAMVDCLAQQRATTHQMLAEMVAKRKGMLRLRLEGTARTATEAALSSPAVEVVGAAVRSAGDWVMALAVEVAEAVGRAVFRL